MKVQGLREEYDSTVHELKDKLIEYKNRLKLEEQKQAQSNDFGFEDDDMGRLQIENESLQRRLKVMEVEKEEKDSEIGNLVSSNTKHKKTAEHAQKEAADLKKQLEDLRNLYTKLELANENLKSSGGNEKMASAALKQYSDLERRYIQTKKQAHFT